MQLFSTPSIERRVTRICVLSVEVARRARFILRTTKKYSINFFLDTGSRPVSLFFPLRHARLSYILKKRVIENKKNDD